MENTNKEVKCVYKKACTAQKWEEHAYKCLNCKHNKNLKEDKKLINWPKRLRKMGIF